MHRGKILGGLAAVVSLSAMSTAAAQECLFPDTVVNLVDRTKPSVVQLRSGMAGGTGFAIESNRILTNAHIIHRGNNVTAILSDRTIAECRVLGRSLENDIALLAIEKPLKPLAIGDSDKVRVGEFTVGIGFPEGLWRASLGIVSAHRILDVGVKSYIETDTPLAPGSSGGPLLNLNGEVIGITSMKMGMMSPFTQAIPINEAMEIAKEIERNGNVQRPVFGARVANYPENGEEYGLVVERVHPGGIAATYGIKAGDILLKVDGKPLQSLQVLMKAIGYRSNKSLHLEVRQTNGKRKVIKIKFN